MSELGGRGQPEVEDRESDRCLQTCLDALRLAYHHTSAGRQAGSHRQQQTTCCTALQQSATEAPPTPPPITDRSSEITREPLGWRSLGERWRRWRQSDRPRAGRRVDVFNPDSRPSRA